MSSLDSQMIVPTLTRFGRVREWTLLDSKRGALVDDVTVALLRVRGEPSRGGRRVACQRMGAAGSPHMELSGRVSGADTMPT